MIYAFKAAIDNIEKIDDQPFLHAASIRLYRVVGLTGIGIWNQTVQRWIDEEKENLKHQKLKQFLPIGLSILRKKQPLTKRENLYQQKSKT